jgi:acyl-CoA thioesterase FadM
VAGRTVYVFVDTKTLGKRPIPDAVRDGLAPYVTG